MVAPTQSLLFSKDNINKLFPFYLLINNELIIEAYGSSMRKLHGNCINKLFTESFQLIRLVEVNINFNTFCTLANKLVIFKINRGVDDAIIIKGQFIYIEKDEQLFFTGTPWFGRIEELRKTGLLINDFPHNNPTIDLLHLLKAEEIINQDLNRLVGTISEQKDKLKKGEAQILISLQKERELNQLKSNFVSLASHEFRTPLACIRSSVELLQMNLTRPDVPVNNTIRHQNNIITEVDHLSELINEVLTVGKIESNTFTCNKESVDLFEILQIVINNLKMIQNDERSINLLAEENPIILMADPLLLRHILNNLLSNSLKYSKGKKQPEVSVIYGNEDVQVLVKDFGIGIPLKQQAKIFQAFFRAENVDQISGTGLGMFITKSFIELHGGKISFKSNMETGTEFIMSLPLA